MEADHAQRRPHRQDTFDLRDQIHPDDQLQAHADAAMSYGTDDEEHSVLEDDSEAEDGEEYIEDDDMSSTLSIPNESIDFDMVYAFHSFAATVEGQANVVKGDSLYLMDDTNSYWWLVRVLKTQEVGYIPAENIETPFERLARLNKHRNIDVSIITLSVFILVIKIIPSLLYLLKRNEPTRIHLTDIWLLEPDIKPLPLFFQTGQGVMKIKLAMSILPPFVLSIVMSPHFVMVK